MPPKHMSRCGAAGRSAGGRGAGRGGGQDLGGLAFLGVAGVHAEAAEEDVHVEGEVEDLGVGH